MRSSTSTASPVTTMPSSIRRFRRTLANQSVGFPVEMPSGVGWRAHRNRSRDGQGRLARTLLGPHERCRSRWPRHDTVEDRTSLGARIEAQLAGAPADGSWRDGDDGSILRKIQCAEEGAGRVAEVIPRPGELRSRLLERIIVADDSPFDALEACRFHGSDEGGQVAAAAASNRGVAGADDEQVAEEPSLRDGAGGEEGGLESIVPADGFCRRGHAHQFWRWMPERTVCASSDRRGDRGDRASSTTMPHEARLTPGLCVAARMSARSRVECVGA